MEINAKLSGYFPLCEVTVLNYKDEEYYKGGTVQNSQDITVVATSIRTLFDSFDKDAKVEGFNNKIDEDEFSRTYKHDNGRIRTYVFDKIGATKKILIDDELLKSFDN